jgi:MFS family permease
MDEEKDNSDRRPSIHSQIHQHDELPTLVTVVDEEQQIEFTDVVKLTPVVSVPERPVTVYNQTELWCIAGISAIASFFSSVSIPIYFPVFAELEQVFNVDTEKMNLTVTVYSLFQAVSPVFWGTLSDIIGRRPVFIMCFIVFIGSCIGLALAQSYWTFFALRIVQAGGIAATVAINSGVVADVTSRKNRGLFMGVSSGIGLIGNAFGPLIGGGISDGLGWRAIFWFLTISAGVILLLILLMLPETNRFIAGDGSYYPRSIINRSPYAYFRRRIKGVPFFKGDPGYQAATPLPRPTVDAFAAIKLLREIDVIMVLVPNALHYATWFMILTAESTLLSSNYGFSSTKIGLAYLASGVGATAGGIISGGHMTYLYKREYEKFRQSCIAQGKEIVMSEFQIQKARLGCSIYASLALSSASIIFGWTLERHVHYVVPILSTFLASSASIYLLNTTNTLLVDLFPGNSATTSAVVNLTRCLVCAAGLAAVDKMIASLGAGGAFTLMAGICLMSMSLIFAELRFGQKIDKRRRLRGALAIR